MGLSPCRSTDTLTGDTTAIFSAVLVLSALQDYL
jgi:hypothetical protein